MNGSMGSHVHLENGQEFNKFQSTDFSRQFSRTGTMQSLNSKSGGGANKSGTSSRFGSGLSLFSGKAIIQVKIFMLDGTFRMLETRSGADGRQLLGEVCEMLEIEEMEYFSLKFFDENNLRHWLKPDVSIGKQLGSNKCGMVEFYLQFRFYPQDFRQFKHETTAHFLHLQLRQDLITGKLPCSFYVYAMLGAYIVQAELGNFMEEFHRDLAYLNKYVFAPESVPADQLNETIADLHSKHQGLSRAVAFRKFLENATRLALYGTEQYEAKIGIKDRQFMHVTVGVNYNGLSMHHEGLGLERIPWPRIDALNCKASQVRVSYFQIIQGGEDRHRDTSINSVIPLSNKKSELLLEFSHKSKASMLFHDLCGAHKFFRLRHFERPAVPKLTVSGGYQHFSRSASRGFMTEVGINNGHFAGENGTMSLQRKNSNSLIRKYSGAKFRSKSSDPNNSSSCDVSIFDDTSLWGDEVKVQIPPNVVVSPPIVDRDDPDHVIQSPAPVVAARPSVVAATGSTKLVRKTYTAPAEVRFHFPRLRWRMSPDDCSEYIGLDQENLNITSKQDAPSAQGCRANFGVRGPGAYYYEVKIVRGKDIRVGWTANNGSFDISSDCLGFGYGSSLDTQTNHGYFSCNGISQSVGAALQPGDVVGCFLLLKPSLTNPNMVSEAIPVFSVNGSILRSKMELQRPSIDLTNTPLYPSVYFRDGQLQFDFEATPRENPLQAQMTKADGSSMYWISLEYLSEDRYCANTTICWRMNPVDSTSRVHLRTCAYGNYVQAASNRGWQGMRANKGVRSCGKYLFEVVMLEQSGLVRVGWSTEDADLFLGYDAHGYGYGADKEGFGISGQQAKKMHNNCIENYGEPFGQDDVIACLLDLNAGVIAFAKNGLYLGQAYTNVPNDDSHIYFPTVSLVDSTVSVNFGERALHHQKLFPDFAPLNYVQHFDESKNWLENLAVDRQEQHLIQPTSPAKIRASLSRPVTFERRVSQFLQRKLSISIKR